MIRTLAGRESGARHFAEATVRIELNDGDHPSLGASACFWNARLPDGVLLDSRSPEKAAELARQAGEFSTPWLNTRRYTADVTIVDESTPRVPVYGAGGRMATKAYLAKILQAGVPIPDGWAPTADSDSHGVFYWPTYVGPTGRRGLLFECWAVKAVPPEEADTLPLTPDGSRYRWKCFDGGRINGTEQNAGRYGDWNWGYKGNDPTHIDSTFISSSWSPTGSGLPLVHGTITVEDIRRGRIEHAIGMMFAGCNSTPRWPASRSDGTWPSNALQEGDRYRLPPGYQVPEDLHPVTGMIVEAARDYGLVGLDVTGGSNLGMRAERAVAEHVGEGQALAGFPWGDLLTLTTGTGSNPNQV